MLYNKQYFSIKTPATDVRFAPVVLRLHVFEGTFEFTKSRENNVVVVQLIRLKGNNIISQCCSEFVLDSYTHAYNILETLTIASRL